MKTSWKRYYADDGQASAEADKAAFRTLLHAAYTHWVCNGYHLRDFRAAVDHVAVCALGDYLLLRAPQLTGALPEVPSIALAGPAKHRGQAQLRLYDELNALAPEVDLTQVERAVRYGVIKWVADGFHPRDFAQFATDGAGAIVYDHMLTQQLSGLGGGRTENQFLTETYHG